MRRRIILIMLATVMALRLGAGVAYAATHAALNAALSKPGAPPKTSKPAGVLAGPTWRLTQLVVDGKIAKPTDARRAPTITFSSNGQFNGFSGCNWYGGSYALTGDRMNFSDMRMTLVACVNPNLTTDSDIMSFEAIYMQTLGRVTMYQVSGRTLTLSDGGGSVTMTYTHSG